MHVRGMHLSKSMLFFLISILAFLAGCTQYKPNSSSFMKPVLTDNQIEKYNIEPVTYKYQNEYQDTLIVYPKLTDASFEKVNELIKTEIFKSSEIDENYKDEEVYEDEIGINYITFDLKYEIKYLSENYISITYTGYFNARRAAHPNNIFYATTINLKTAAVLSLSNFVESYEYLENKIKSNNYEILYGGLQTFNKDEIIKFIHSKFEDAPIEKNKNHFYISEDGNICVIIDLPQAGGGYSIIKIDMEK